VHTPILGARATATVGEAHHRAQKAGHGNEGQPSPGSG
jgi:hypothetical protein